MTAEEIKSHFEECINTKDFDEVRYSDSMFAFVKGAEWMLNIMKKEYRKFDVL